MIKRINYNNIPIRYNDEGNGYVVVLLHGYLESIETWGEFAQDLSQHFRVICIDLPGHGGTGCFSKEHTMDFMAKIIHFVLENLSIKKSFLIGHSMGGYVALAFLDKYAAELSGVSLLHSTPFADSAEKKTNRDRTIKMVNEGKKELLYKEHVPKTFAKSNLEKFATDINIGMKIAKTTTEKGIIAALTGMKNRPDRNEIISGTSLPFLYVQGLKDNFITANTVNEISFPVNHKIVLLKNSGHMGFIEEKNKCLDEYIKFINMINS